MDPPLHSNRSPFLFPAEEAEDASKLTKRDRSHLENTLKLNEDKPADDFSGVGGLGGTEPLHALLLQST